MRSISRLVATAALLMLASVAPAGAWWSYARWGLSEPQILSVSSGRAVPCREDVPVCARTPNGGQPTLFVEAIEMVGSPASVSFAFDGEGRLAETTVLFAHADFALISNLMRGIHGTPVDDRPGASPSRTWRDERRGSVITATPAGSGARLSYRPG